jgi:hypothetical protein
MERTRAPADPMSVFENGVRARRCKVSADVSIDWVPFKLVPQAEDSFEVRAGGDTVGGPMPHEAAVTFATRLAEEAAAEGKLGIVAQCTEREEIVSVKFYEPQNASAVSA